MEGPDAMLDALVAAGQEDVAAADARAADAVFMLDPLTLGVRSRAAVARGGPAAADALVLLHARLAAAAALPCTSPEKRAAARELLAEFSQAMTIASHDDAARAPTRWVLTGREAARLVLATPRETGFSRMIVAPLRDACRKLAPTRLHVVPLHADYVAVCIHAGCYEVALYFVDPAVALRVDRAEMERRKMRGASAALAEPPGGEAHSGDKTVDASRPPAPDRSGHAPGQDGDKEMSESAGRPESNGIRAHDHGSSSYGSSSARALHPGDMQARTAMDIAADVGPRLAGGYAARGGFVPRVVYDPQVVCLSAADVLCEHYYLSVVYTALHRFPRALQHCRLALAVPSSVLCDIAVATYRRYILISLLDSGKVPSEPTVCSYMANRLRSHATEYIDLGKAYASANIDGVRKLATSHRQLFDSHANLGLVERLVESVPRRAICALTDTFVSLSLEDVARQARLDGGAAEAESLVVKMVAAGEIRANVDARRGVVRFSADDEDDEHEYTTVNVDPSEGKADRAARVSSESDSARLSGANVDKVLSCVEGIHQFRNAVLCDAAFVARKMASEREHRLTGGDGALGIGMEDEHDID